MPENKKPIIIKKIKKGGGGHHGGAWKVAYADFVTAMMAFFLLMWLLNMVSEEKKIALSKYFNEFNLFEQGGKTFLSGEGGGSPLTEAAKPSKYPTNLEEGEDTPPQFEHTSSNADMEMEALKAVEIKKEKFKEELTKVIEKKLKDLENQIIIEVVDKGVRIQLVDQERGSSIFERGSIYLTDTAKRALMVITESLNEMPNNLAIEGHTDSHIYSGSKYTNWELSTDRASSARRTMEEFGLNPKRIMQVAGYADTQLLIKNNPTDAKNRRISILVAFTKDQKTNNKK